MLEIGIGRSILGLRVDLARRDAVDVDAGAASSIASVLVNMTIPALDAQ
jgi:hypothetical protein